MAFETATKRGVVVHYGPRTIKQNYGGAHGSRGRVKTAVWTLDYADVNADFSTADLGADALALALPAGAVILSATLDIKTAFDGTTITANIGLENSAGTAIDADGIDAAVSLASVGSIACDGALVGTTIGEAAGYLAIVGSAADNTVGELDLIVEYVVM